MKNIEIPFLKLLEVLFLSLTIIFFSACTGDSVNVINDSGNEIGILVDGMDLGVQVNDQTYIAASSPIAVGDMTSSPAGNEIIGFTKRRPVAVLSDAGWTAASDVAVLNFNNSMQLPVKVWVVFGPFADARTRAINACITTSSIWRNERMGVDFSSFEIVDATGDPDASTYYDFTCTLQAGIRSDIGFTAGRINIYYVRTVDGGTGRGQACQIGSDFAAMGSGTLSDLLSHELGHGFGLNHVDANVANFDVTNILHSASNTRAFISEGQLFRAHLRTTSALNFLYNARPGLPTRNCADATVSDACPAIQKRIWADGTFAAN